MANMRTPPFSNFASAVLCSVALLCSASLTAQTAAPAVRIVGPVDASQLVTLKGNTPLAARAINDLGPVSSSMSMPDLTLVLSRGAERQAAFDAYVAAQYDPSSPDYHQWLTPQQIGDQFGPAPADIATVTTWLTSQGFAVKSISPDRMTIRFGGTAGQAQTAFHTQIHNLASSTGTHFGNMTDPQIPAALAPVIVGIKALHNFLPRPLHRLGNQVSFNQQSGQWQHIATSASAGSATPNAQAAPAISAHPLPLYGINVPTSNGYFPYLEEDVAPSDFATIYNVQPLWTANINGAGQTIAIAGTSFINLNDVTSFRSVFGLPAGSTPQQIDTGQGPPAIICSSSTGACNVGDLIENSLDVEWSGAVATGAQIKLVVTGQNTSGTIDTVFDSAQYVVNNPSIASILSVSYGFCELGQGTAGNVAYEQLWQIAAAEGISVFVATGDSGSPSCDQGGDSIGNPYSAQYGLSVSGIASTPYNTAVGGTDFSWCKPVYNSAGTAITGCPSSSSAQGSPAYWNTSNNGTTGASAAGYVPEIPWNDSCLNPIWASYIQSLAPLVAQATGAATPTNPEAACNYVQNNWSSIYSNYQSMLATFVDTVGGSGGASNCVVNDSTNLSSCNPSITNTGAFNGNIPLYNDGWVKPPWQTGVAGIPNDGVRDIPDVSFFAGDGTLQSATLICVSALGTCVTSGQLASPTTEPTAQEVGGTSVATPQMAGVMALINQKAGAAQGLANPQLYSLAARQTYSQCSAESVTTSTSCYFNDIDQGTISMPCDNGASIGGTVYSGSTWQQSSTYQGIVSPNCAALNSGDQVGTLVSSGTTPAYNGAAGFDLATGLGSLNVANVVNAWVSTAGTNTATLALQASPTTITINQAVAITVSATGNAGTVTGSVTVTGGGYSAIQSLSAGSATFNIPANSLAAGSDTLTVYYSGDPNYARTSNTANVTVDVMTPTVTVSAPSAANYANALTVSVSVAGPTGSVAIPTGTVSLSGGGYNSAAATLSAGSATIIIPANRLAGGNDTLTVTYSGDTNYAGNTGSTTVTIVTTPPVPPTIVVTPATTTVNSGTTLAVTATLTGAGPTPTGTATLKAGSYTSPATALTGGIATFTIPSNSLPAGSATLTLTYSGDVYYASGTGTGTVTVTQSAYTLAATTPAAIAHGATTTSTVTVSSSTAYSGTVTLTCAATSGPTNAAYIPVCSPGSTVTMTNGAASGTATLTISTTATTAMLHTPETRPGSKGWLGAGGGFVLAFLVFLGIPARSRSWRAMLGVLVLMVALGSLSACGGGGSSSSSGTTIAGTTPGTYTFTVTGAGSPTVTPAPTATFTLTVN